MKHDLSQVGRTAGMFLFWRERLITGSVRNLSRNFLPTFLVSVRAYFSLGLRMAMLAQSEFAKKGIHYRRTPIRNAFHPPRHGRGQSSDLTTPGFPLTVGSDVPPHPQNNSVLH